MTKAEQIQELAKATMKQMTRMTNKQQVVMRMNATLRKFIKESDEILSPKKVDSKKA